MGDIKESTTLACSQYKRRKYLTNACLIYVSIDSSFATRTSHCYEIIINRNASTMVQTSSSSWSSPSLGSGSVLWLGEGLGMSHPCWLVLPSSLAERVSPILSRSTIHLVQLAIFSARTCPSNIIPVVYPPSSTSSHLCHSVSLQYYPGRLSA